MAAQLLYAKNAAANFSKRFWEECVKIAVIWQYVTIANIVPTKRVCGFVTTRVTKKDKTNGVY